MDHLERLEVLGALARCSHGRCARYSWWKPLPRSGFDHRDPHVPVGALRHRVLGCGGCVRGVRVLLARARSLACGLPIRDRRARTRVALRPISTTCGHRRRASPVGPLVHSGDRLVDDVSLAVICVFGLLAQPWPTNQSTSRRSTGATTA